MESRMNLQVGKIYFGKYAGLGCQGAKASDWPSHHKLSNQKGLGRLFEAALEMVMCCRAGLGFMPHTMSHNHAADSVCHTSACLQVMNIGLITPGTVRSKLGNHFRSVRLQIEYHLSLVAEDLSPVR
jgi:hypothetical protein